MFVETPICQYYFIGNYFRAIVNLLITNNFPMYMQVSIHVNDQHMWMDREPHGRGATCCLYLWPMSCIVVVFRAYVHMLLVHLELMSLDP